jgi:NAD(P)-dependent dehydrogenase (short-subunit alcohol dehydrogenase family)
MRFENKTVIVTGAAGGIGLAIAERFSEEGANIVMTDINADKLKEAADKLNGGDHSKPLLLTCDVSKEEEVKNTFEKASGHFGHVDIIVNNAGMMIFKKLVDHTAEDWQRILNVDLMGAFYFTKYAFLNMKPGGAIINISSIHAIETTPMVASYAASKAALLSLTRSSAIEGKEKGIRVNAILPGAIDTPMLWDNPNIKAGIEKVDKNSVGKAADIAAVAAFLASEDAAFVQGAMIVTDGGRIARL